MPATRELHLNVNLLGGLGEHPGAWRWPGTDPLSFLHVDRYVEAAVVAERGTLDAVFLADSPGIVQDIHTLPPYNGLEPTLVLTAIARATERIGLIGTASTSYNEPYNVARRFMTLDLISHGRVAWNAVTTYNSASARNFGGTEPTREQRYSRGNEFVDVVRALWTSWQPGALIADEVTGQFADPDRIRPIEHVGEHFTVRGALTLPPSEQGYPVIYQAGGGVEGRDLAGRTADAVFSAAVDEQDARTNAAAIRRAALGYGRAPDSIIILPGLRTSVASTEREAVQRREALRDLADQTGVLKGLATKLRVDAGALHLDHPVPPQLLTEVHGPAGPGEDTLLRQARQGSTVRELLRAFGPGHLVAVGTPEHVADTIERWFSSGAADGFNLMPDTLHDGLPDFVDHVIPILRRRGLFRTGYRGTTLREHYGLPVPVPARPVALAG
ncbi:NtaA/DmoA family FMN-dependent monooxygenase [Dactylosporangium siamense]|uniref:Nitrilotriacetate monooxygenase n=1 Tax=Dactylosporangium siamense TaxID=685454 RepID=A0A919PES9_9ACTN|nr:NtaA/DmoA family FMN-dependent monooxygenase [Dactylosporangium siamense]GIG42614.1 nitrilotriacetate monooxygenase [Dactylosporangium siamense]